MSDDEWSRRQERFADGTSRAEQRADVIASELLALREFIASDHRKKGSQFLLAGLQLGLAFHDTFLEVSELSALIVEAREGVTVLDAEVAKGALPATAHSWKFQLAERLKRLESRVAGFDPDLRQIKLNLERLTKE